MKKFLTLLVLLLSGCGSREPSSPIPPSLEQELSARVEAAEKWAIRDANGAPTKVKADGSPDTGDALLWAGILCSSNPAKFQASCEQVKASQGADGRIWRHPSRVEVDLVNSFSRDMAIGLLLYVQATQDVTFLQKWVDYVVENGQACTEATDNRCEMTTIIWSLAKLAAPEINLHGKQVLSPKQVLAVLYAAATGGESGYPLHLIAQQLILLKRAGESGAVLWQETAKALYKRDSSNALFAYLAGRLDSATLLMLEQLPAKRPSGASQWSFERESSSRAWMQSMGWEYVWLYYVMQEGK